METLYYYKKYYVYFIFLLKHIAILFSDAEHPRDYEVLQWRVCHG